MKEKVWRHFRYLALLKQFLVLICKAVWPFTSSKAVKREELWKGLRFKFRRKLAVSHTSLRAAALDLWMTCRKRKASLLMMQIEWKTLQGTDAFSLQKVKEKLFRELTQKGVYKCSVIVRVSHLTSSPKPNQESHDFIRANGKQHGALWVRVVF